MNLKDIDKRRFDYDLNYQLFKNKKYTSPINISWGYDNRTTAIRIPKSENENRRIEFRVPPANINPDIVILKVLEAIKYGIENRLNPPEPIYGNAFDKQYQLKRLDE